ncbi:uncharacterized protein BDZ83DRAFT_197500 [Colletotrichum acutatum]|uniref:Uncharacterized protein n=1 Tax=Glomerella acutata TaxID=27357 RepID=A0AAD8UUM2_GLOAC|nr:uncharacterized protein BDZ83DRAFT_197500 [Colletotrichum acutatum]KAK1727616.1 hypothetical protein BDZ83DRAFT_197500 [Colletotrichum acutatum]
MSPFRHSTRIHSCKADNLHPHRQPPSTPGFWPPSKASRSTTQRRRKAHARHRTPSKPRVNSPQAQRRSRSPACRDSELRQEMVASTAEDVTGGVALDSFAISK